MKRLRHYLFVRHRHNWSLLARFAIVGGSGVVVNLAVYGLLIALAPSGHDEQVFLNLPWSEFNIRYYHVYSTVAFFVANISNFQLNRIWTFKSVGKAPWFSEYFPFLAVGLLGQALGLLILTALVHEGSPVALPQPGGFFVEDSVLRNRKLWAQAIMIAVVTPVSFVGNKVWTFRSVRGANSGS